MSQKTKITEIKEKYTVKRRVRDGSGENKFEEKNFTRYKEVIYVEGWARFVHYSLDYLFYQIFLTVLYTPLILALRFFNISLDLQFYIGSFSIDLLSLCIFYPGYYILFEATMQASPAKWILKRVVVNEYGEKPTFRQIVIRSYSRIVPFEAFSCFGGIGWHDTWSDTYVIRKKDLYELQLAIKTQEFGEEELVSPSLY